MLQTPIHFLLGLDVHLQMNPFNLGHNDSWELLFIFSKLFYTYNFALLWLFFSVIILWIYDYYNGRCNEDRDCVYFINLTESLLYYLLVEWLKVFEHVCWVIKKAIFFKALLKFAIFCIVKVYYLMNKIINFLKQLGYWHNMIEWYRFIWDGKIVTFQYYGSLMRKTFPPLFSFTLKKI